MNIVKRLLLTIALLISAGKVLAEEAKPVEKSSQNFIAVVDLHYILENSLAVKDLRLKIEVITKNLHDKMTLKELELKKDESRLIDQKGQVEKKLYEKEASVFTKKVSQAQKDSQQQKVKLEKAYSDGIVLINNHIINIIKKFCETNGCRVVLPSSQILYADESLNISLEILEKLNQQISLINVNF